METQVSKCNHCGMLTEDSYNNRGWIRFSGLQSIALSKGRKDGHAKSEFKNIDPPLDFCSFKCLRLYFKKLWGGK